MTDHSFADLFQPVNKKTRLQASAGDRVEVTVVGIDKAYVYVDMGTKSEGALDLADFKDSEGKVSVRTGERVAVYLVEGKDGEMRPVRRLGGGGREALAEAHANVIPVEGTVKGEVKGGFEISLGGTRAFCPASQIDLRPGEAAGHIGQRRMFRITRYGEHGRNIVVSARALQEEERESQREQLKTTLREGMLVQGRVVAVRDFGAFVDIGGADGLIPRSELAWGQVNDPGTILQPGQEVQVLIKQVDWERQRISLSLRDTLPDPWTEAAALFPVSSVHQGRVERLQPFGAFVSLAPGVEGLVHISRLGRGRRLHHPKEVLEVGQEITVRVESFDLEHHRLALAPDDLNDTSPVSPASPGRPLAQASDCPEAKPTESPMRPVPSLGTFADLLAGKITSRKR